MEAVLKSQLSDQFHFIDFTYDIQSVYKKMNVLCFPSHYDAPGRPIFEAAFYGVPSIVAVLAPRTDTLINGVTGLAIPPRNPAKLAEAIQTMVLDPGGCERMGKRARELAIKNFSVFENVQRLLDVYRHCLEQR
jgi:glycosyltransferase involved in cell wall biosynthesis